MSFIIVTGMSGAGRSVAIKHLEDMGYFCVDNLPPQLVVKFAEMCYHSQNHIEQAAVVIDMRGGDAVFEELFVALEEMRSKNYAYEILFMDATEQVLAKRYKETRRAHPLMRNGTTSEGIKEERIRLQKIKSVSTHVIDTSNLLPRKLKEVLNQLLNDEVQHKQMLIDVLSFGFKYGAPTHADLMFDVRFLPNPYYIQELRPLTGQNEKVKEYIFRYQQTEVFLEKIFDLLEFLIPYYIEEGKTQLVIGIGCTGGKHRSVAIAEQINAQFKQHGYRSIVQHNDMGKE